MRELTTVEKQWLFSKEDLAKTPSVSIGYTTEKELQKRKSTIHSIRSLARLAGLYEPRDPNHHGARGVMTVASTLVHRFYMRRSFNDFPDSLMAGTILFLASKIEEEPLKLRYICNACLDRFHDSPGSGWHPGHQENGPPPSSLYQRWERDILATEEIVLETLCFDMGIEQPWVVLQRSLRGMDDIPLNVAESSRQAEERARTIEQLSEAVVAELGWAMLNEAYSSPLPILHPAPILAFSTLVLLIALLERIPLSRATATGAELASRFGLDITFDEIPGAKGSDLEQVRLCMEQFVEYCKADLIDEALIAFIAPEPETPTNEKYVRRYQVEGSTTSTTSTTIKPEQSPQTKPEIPATSTTVESETHMEPAPAAPVSAADIPVIEPKSVPEPMDVDDPNVHSNDLAKATDQVKPDAQISDDDDLFGEKADSASGMSPPRY